MGAAKRTLDGEDRSETIAEERKAGRKVGEKWSAKLVPSPAASNSPSTLGAVSATDAILEPFCPTIEQPWKQLRAIERGMDRSRRATNPDQYQSNGTIE